MATFYNLAQQQQQQQHEEENDDEHWFLDNNHLKQQHELYNIVPSNTTSNSTTTTTTTTTANECILDSYPWLSIPLSPPITKNEQTTASPVSYRSPYNPGAWHSLWSSSTWQNNSASEPQKRSRSISTMQFPSSFHDGDASTVDDSFYRIDNSISHAAATNKSPLLSPLASRGFMTNGGNNETDKSSSIWSFEYNQPLVSIEERRHSIAVIQQHYARPITPPSLHPLQQQQQQQQQQPPVQQQLMQHLQQQQIDEYFKAPIDVQRLGNGVSLDQFKPDQETFLVQFKGDYRSDWFYVQQDDMMRIQLDDKKCFQLGDMVIVEADRGYDLGKIVVTSKKSSMEKGVTCIKRIFRHASAAELAIHQLNQQEEQKALIFCQAKIEQKKLDMEIVDAEYQWDKRKLTFYFKANTRIDFRELVRELFKIYKTRIWMCAYPSSTTTTK